MLSKSQLPIKINNQFKIVKKKGTTLQGKGAGTNQCHYIDQFVPQEYQVRMTSFQELGSVVV